MDSANGNFSEILRNIKKQCSKINIVVFYSNIDKSFINEFQNYISAFLSKDISASEFLNSIKRVHKGGKYVDAFVSQDLLLNNDNSEINNSIIASLTTQEKRVLNFLAEGKTNKEIAEELYLSTSTIRSYVSNILRKLNIPNRAAAAAFASKNID